MVKMAVESPVLPEFSKRACNARDKRDEVFGNIFGEVPNKKPRAKIKIDSGDGLDIFPEWEEGKQGPAILSKIAVFDSKCARILIDERNEYQYKPYGTHIFEDLVKLLEEFKAKISAEQPKPEKPIITDLIEGTAAHTFYQNYGVKSTQKEISIYECWSTEEEKRLNETKEWLDAYEKENLDIKINSLNNTIKKYIGLLKDIRKIAREFSVRQMDDINDKITAIKAAEDAQKIAEKAISDHDFPLRGVKSEAWRQLFEIAEKYSKTNAYPGAEFPNTGSGALCVLCMQELKEDAQKRMLRFKEFVLDEVGKKLMESRSALIQLEKKYQNYHIRTVEDLKLYIDDLQAQEPGIASSFIDTLTYFNTLLKKVKLGIANKINLETSVFPHVKDKLLFQWLKAIKKKALDYETSKKPDEVGKRRKEHQELVSKKLVFTNIAKLKDFLDKSKLAEKYQSCLNALDSRSISKIGRDIISEQSTPELQKCLQNELDFLGAKSFDIKFKPHGEKGITVHEFEFSGATVKQLPSKILSEGEQKAVGIAGFFAELKAGQP